MRPSLIVPVEQTSFQASPTNCFNAMPSLDFTGRRRWWLSPITTQIPTFHCPFIHSFIHPSILSIYSFIHSFQSFILFSILSTHLFIHSLNPTMYCQVHFTHLIQFSITLIYSLRSFTKLFYHSFGVGEWLPEKCERMNDSNERINDRSERINDRSERILTVPLAEWLERPPRTR